jgi:hypothetical protein
VRSIWSRAKSTVDDEYGRALMANVLEERARRLRNAVEPIAAGIYFAPEAHAAYVELGFGGSPVHEGGRAAWIGRS